jgi:predicted signal transduction protein with EAL and GGDEF domain
MSLIKQLWLAILVLTTLTFGGAFVVSTLAARHYFAEQLYVKNVDNATSLALSMSQFAKDPVTVELQLAAQFDTGHYRLIRLSGPDGKSMVERLSSTSSADVPGWFQRLVPLEAPAVVAQVQDGWHQFGTLTVESSNRFAYEELWRATQRMLGWFAFAAVFCGVAGSALLRLILRPLREVVAQAEAMGRRRFIINREPTTPEFRSVVRAMNALAERMRIMVEEESRRVDELRRQVHADPLTGLLHRASFLDALDARLAQSDKRGGGSLAILRIPDLAERNHRDGHEATDQFLRHLADRMTALGAQHAEWLGARLNGTDFALLAPGEDDAAALAEQLSNAAGIATADPADGRQTPIFIGVTRFTAGEPASGLLARADGALASSEHQGQAVVAPLPETLADALPIDRAAWRTLLEGCLQSGAVTLGSFPVVSPGGQLLHFEAPLRLVLSSGELPAGRFVAWAARLGLMPRFDALVVERALERIARDGQPMCVHVSAEALADTGFVAQLAARLARDPGAAQKLWLEVPEYGAYRHVTAFRAFCLALKPSGCRIGLEHVGAQISHIGDVHDLGLDYFKIDASVVRGIDHNPGNQAFLRALCMMAHAIGLTTIAEGVTTEAEQQALPGLGIDGLSGPAIRFGARG